MYFTVVKNGQGAFSGPHSLIEINWCPEFTEKAVTLFSNLKTINKVLSSESQIIQDNLTLAEHTVHSAKYNLSFQNPPG